MLGKLILWLTAIIFTGYGLACLASPALPADYAGLVMSNGDSFAEMGAMYGGLQTGFGLFCLVAALKPAYTRAGLLLIALAIGLLGTSRLYFVLAGADPLTVYTWGALSFELVTAGLAILALAFGRAPAPEATTS